MTDILNQILNFAFSGVNGLISDAPTFSISGDTFDAVVSGMQVIYDLIVEVNFLIPLDQICVMIGIDLTLRVSKFATFAINWIIRRVCDVTP